MAKRIVPLSSTGRPPDGQPAATVCRICGGLIVVEDLSRPDRYPDRRICRRCGAEYATTRPASRNY